MNVDCPTIRLDGFLISTGCMYGHSHNGSTDIKHKGNGRVADQNKYYSCKYGQIKVTCWYVIKKVRHASNKMAK